ncbi:dihydrodipicolinate synthase/n-acetylneuraminate lyase [Halovivax asiaticus JCM 14624]|uniref:Dihydrodipicolinate synthase/n-acetylneuraminate lyase n=1 Tax=Halovivax asiaticus JCM 14624 TaxID=1227490 RepID=M0BF12_9EURY|nr:dihydrodipicolinate synthase family protein [Halovivax asiaticus]ELZ08893.1 dihydrodipicolinate synthase/n-acetylneuraminate lyase [Halovivax asiaticus JCM 14624]
MQGTGVPIVTPFTADGVVDHDRLISLVAWLEADGVDFLVPCGSTGEAPLLTSDERRAVVETVADAAEGPVVAGTGREGFEPTLATTEAAADAGADAALVVTPSYYGQGQAALETYYRDLADESPIPIYLYSVPKFTDCVLAPETVAGLATHETIAGIKDSSGNVDRLQRTVGLTADADFAVLVGSGGVYASALDVGADGGILGVANLVPELVADLAAAHARGDGDTARSIQATIAGLNELAVSEFGVAGVKAALELRDRPAGAPRRPLRPLDADGRVAIETELERIDAL